MCVQCGNARSEASGPLKSLGTLAAGIAHQFNNINASAISYLDIATPGHSKFQVQAERPARSALNSPMERQGVPLG